MPLGKKSLAELRECLASWTLKEIRDLFESEDIPFSENYKSPHTGQRRSLADSYLVSINLSNHDDAGRVLKAFEHVLVKLTAAIEDNSGTSTAADAERSLKNLLRWLQRDGFDFENGRLAAVGTRTSEVPAPVMPKQEAVTEPAMPACSSAGPTAFVSYSWDNEEHKQWVLDFATRLRHEGIDAKLDRWDVSLGDPLPQFMETAVRTNKFVLIVLTPNYAEKSDRRKSTYSAHHVVLRDQSATASRAGKTRKVLISHLITSNGTHKFPSWTSSVRIRSPALTYDNTAPTWRTPRRGLLFGSSTEALLGLKTGDCATTAPRTAPRNAPPDPERTSWTAESEQ